MKIGLFVVLSALSVTAHAMNYSDAVITGVGVATSDTVFRFTIDRDPNVILTIDGSNDQAKRLIALVTAAYLSQSPVKLVQSVESSSSSTLHYVGCTFVSVGTRTWD